MKVERKISQRVLRRAAHAASTQQNTARSFLTDAVRTRAPRRRRSSVFASTWGYVCLGDDRLTVRAVSPAEAQCPADCLQIFSITLLKLSVAALLIEAHLDKHPRVSLLPCVEQPKVRGRSGGETIASSGEIMSSTAVRTLRAPAPARPHKAFALFSEETPADVGGQDVHLQETVQPAVMFYPSPQRRYWALLCLGLQRSLAAWPHNLLAEIAGEGGGGRLGPSQPRTWSVRTR